MSSTHNYKVGDEVIITASKYGHRFDIGDIVVLESYSHPNAYNAKHIDGTGINWCIEEDEFIMPPQDSPKPKLEEMELKFKIDQKVTVCKEDNQAGLGLGTDAVITDTDIDDPALPYYIEYVDDYGDTEHHWMGPDEMCARGNYWALGTKKPKKDKKDLPELKTWPRVDF